MSLVLRLSPAVLLLLSLTARATPEKLQAEDEQAYLPKIDLACGIKLSLSFDGDSLRKSNKDIGHDQTDGANECNEPLRYLWYLCHKPAGKAAVQAARIARVACKGTSGNAGALKVSSGTITVERANEETKPYVRSRKQLEAALKTAVPLPRGTEDPYQDEGWHDLKNQPNAVTSMTTYCLVNGAKVEFSENAGEAEKFHGDTTVRCFKDGQLVTDAVYRNRRATGFETKTRGDQVDRSAYRDGKRDGEWRTTKGGVVTSVAVYAKDEEVWSREFLPNTTDKLTKYSRHHAHGYAKLETGADGKVYDLRCAPEVRGDQTLHKICGFDGPVTTQVYDGTGAVNRVLTYKDGELVKEGAGQSDYSQRSEVAYQGGKKHGEERVTTKDAKLVSVTTWSHGERDGKETFYDEDGKKVVEEIVWKTDHQLKLTDWYLNGNPRLKEVYDGDKKKQVQAFWDTGKVSAEGLLLRCEQDFFGYHFSDWCEEGIYRIYYESGAKDSEISFHEGKRSGTAKSWWENGKPAAVEEYADGTLVRAKEWDKDGVLKLDEEYEKDGSVKIRAK